MTKREKVLILIANSDNSEQTQKTLNLKFGLIDLQYTWNSFIGFLWGKDKENHIKSVVYCDRDKKRLKETMTIIANHCYKSIEHSEILTFREMFPDEFQIEMETLEESINSYFNKL